VVGLTTRDVLDVADAGESIDWTSRGVLLTGCAWPHASAEECAALPIGVRDRLLLALRLRTFGSDTLVRFRCPSCAAQREARLDLAALLAAHQAEPPSRIAVDVCGETVDVRLPTSADLLAAAGLPEDESARVLFERCLLSAPPIEPDALRRSVSDAIAAADPISALDVELVCDVCHARSSESFDIVSSFWKEIEAAARHAASDVHALARVYGWPEAVILAMTPARRARYLAMTQS
jgi:hypothetical protein